MDEDTKFVIIKLNKIIELLEIVINSLPDTFSVEEKLDAIIKLLEKKG